MAAETRKSKEKNEGRRKDLNLIHARLGHVSLSKMKHINFCDCKGWKDYFCDMSSIAKLHRLPFMTSTSIVECVFDLVHMDWWGPYDVKAISGASYFLTIVDDHSRVT